MFLHAFAIGIYLVPLPNILKAAGLESITAIPYCLAAAASFISPMIMGSLADRRYAPERLLGVVALGAAALITLTYHAIDARWGASAYLTLAGLYHLWAAPGWGLLTSVGLMHLERPETEFAPLRVWATIGFMAGAAAASYVLRADDSPICGYAAGVVFFLEALFCATLPPSHPKPAAHPKRLRDYLGWDAMKLLADRDHRMVFLTTALYSVPLAAFYPYTPKLLGDLGVEKVSGRMALAQVSEVIGMYALAAIMGRFRLKWLLLAGLALGAARYGLYATTWLPAVLFGIMLHGLIYTLFSMTTQIYVEKRIDTALRNQAQALLLLMANGFGGLAGFGLSGLLYEWCRRPQGLNWPIYWMVLTMVIVLVTIYFVAGYRGQNAASHQAHSDSDAG